MKTIVLGGGLGGLESAIYLRKNGIDVTLVSDRDYLYLYPISIWIPTSKKTINDVSFPLETFAKVHGFTLIVDPVKQINTQENTVELETQTLSYDNLIVALGTAKMQPKGVEHAPSICGKPEESLHIKSQLEALIKKGSGTISMGFGGNPKDSSAVRGGPAFELIFNVHNHLKSKGIRDNFTLNFFAPMQRPGQKMGEEAVDVMFELFKKQNINTYFGKKITEFHANGVRFEDDSMMHSDMTMFIAAGTGNPIAKQSGFPLSDAGFIQIEETCKVKGLDNVFAVGDVASIEGVEWRAKQGHLAEAMGKAAAFNIHQKEIGSNLRHTYKEHMNIICLMDDGKGGAMIFRSTKRSLFIPLPIIGHWMKKGWGWYYKNSKLKRFPRLPGM